MRTKKTETAKRNCCITEYDLETKSYKLFCPTRNCYTNCCKLSCKIKANDKIEPESSNAQMDRKVKNYMHINSKFVVGKIDKYINYCLSNKNLIAETIKQIKQYCNFNSYQLSYTELIAILKEKLLEYGLKLSTTEQCIRDNDNKIIFNFRYSNNK